MEGDAKSFSLDLSVSPSTVQEVVIRSIDKLLERDNPSLETIKMQVEYDASFLRDETEAQKALRVRNKMIASHKMAIVEVEMEDASDFEALTTLYRKIFRFLLDFAPYSKIQDRTIEREVAAALESVFPRVGLKAFVQLGFDEKSAQLLELARIVLGIRLFNRDQGRGGVGIDDLDKTSLQSATSMAQEMEREVDYFTDACGKYQRAIISVHLQKRRQEIYAANETKRIEDEKAKALADDHEYNEDEEEVIIKDAHLRETETKQFSDVIVPDSVVDRWSKELANRRQYLGFLRAIQDEVRSIQEKIARFGDSIQIELSNLKALVGSKSSVPKEVVYPRFDSLGSLWVQLYEEATVLAARKKTFQSLLKYRLSFNPSLNERTFADHGLEQSLMEIAEPKSHKKEGRDYKDTMSKASLDDSETKVSQGDGDSIADGLPEDDEYDSGAVLLSVHNTPDFMLLPLELQGYCPWTIVHARGLLIPGKPALGVVRFDNMYYVCDHVAGLRAFLQNPRYYLDELRERVMANPEFIHLLRLQRWFPSTAISRLLDQSKAEQRPFGGKPATRDAATGTPTHFIESHIDNNYHWNEWELRRRALKVVNLQNSVTTSQQTDASHFRRDMDTQVYEPRVKGTQTLREKGTNPPIVTTYITGLRGTRALDATAVSKYVRGAGSDSKAQSKDEKNAARVVTLKLDL